MNFYLKFAWLFAEQIVLYTFYIFMKSFKLITEYKCANSLDDDDDSINLLKHKNVTLDKLLSALMVTGTSLQNSTPIFVQQFSLYVFSKA